MKVKVDDGLCTGHGRCYSSHPDLFEPDDEGYTKIRDQLISVPAGKEQEARQAAHACPERAITVIDPDE
jgi:ferredoxin